MFLAVHIITYTALGHCIVSFKKKIPVDQQYMTYMYKQQVLQYNTTYLCSGRKKALKFWKLNINIILVPLVNRKII